MSITVEQYKAMSKPAIKNKYNAVRARADGIMFHSTAEKDYYLHLKRDATVQHIHRQIPLRYALGDGPWRSLIVDFMIQKYSGDIVFVDVKGMVLPSFIHKKEAVEAFYPGLKIVIVKKVDGKFFYVL